MSVLGKLRPAIGRRKWILWATVVLVVVVAWFVVVSLLPRHVVDTIRHYEETPNGLREPPRGTRSSP